MAGEDLGAIRGRIEIEYDDRGVGKAKDDIDDLEAKADRSTGAIAGFFGGMAAGIVDALGGVIVQAGQTIAGFATDSLRSFGSFQQGMNEVFTLLPGISGDAMTSMTNQVLDTAREMEVLPEEVVPALYSALSAGIPPDNVFDFLITSNQLAQGGVTSLDTAVTSISGTVNAYGADVVSAEQVSDALFTAVRTGATTIDELGASLANVVPTAAGLGIGIEQVTAAISTMTAQGVPTAQATTQLRQLFVELSKAGGEAAVRFEEMSGKTFRDFVASGGNVQEALQLMEEAAQQDGVALTDLFGSVEAGNAALFLTGGATETFSNNLAAQADSAGATEQAFNTMQAGITDAWDEARVAIDVFTKKALMAVGPLIEDFTRGAVAAFQWLQTTGFQWFRDEAVPVIQELGRILLEYLQPAISTVANFVVGALNFMKTDGFDILQNNVIPTIAAVVRFFDRFRRPIQIVAAIIATVLIPHFVALGIAATINAAKAVIAWVSMQIAAVRSAVVHSIQVVRMVAGWVLLGVTATVQAARTVVAWVLMGTAAMANAARVAAAWVIANAGAAASMATMAVTAARFVAGWVLMGTQALIQAARVALAWLIAMGPIALIIAAVIGLVILIVANWETIWEWTKKIFGMIWDFIKGIVDFVIDLFLNWTPLGIIISNWEAIWDFLVGLWDSIVQFFMDGLQFVLDLFFNWTPLGIIISNWEAIWDFLVGIWNAIIGFIQDGIALYTGIIRGGLDFVRNLWTTVWNSIRNFVSNVFSAIRTVFTTYVNFWRTIITNGLNFIRNLWNTVWNGARNTINTIVNAIRNIVQSGIDRVKSIIRGISAIIDTVRNAFNNAKNAASDRINALLDLVRGLPNRAKSALGNLVSKLYSAGRDLISGLINGIRDMAGQAAQAAIDAVSGAIDAAKDFLGIGSPSKLARDVIGGPIMQGIALGEVRNAKLPTNALIDALSTLPSAVSPTVNAVLSGESGGSRAYTFGPGSIVLDVSRLKSIDDVVKAVEGLKPTSRTFVRKP